MPKFLMQQRSGWYAVVQIPKELRCHFGKARFKQSLKTDSLPQAKVRLWPIGRFDYRQKDSSIFVDWEEVYVIWAEGLCQFKRLKQYQSSE